MLLVENTIARGAFVHAAGVLACLVAASDVAAVAVRRPNAVRCDAVAAEAAPRCRAILMGIDMMDVERA